MIVTTGCGPLFDSFVAAGLNTKQIMQDLGAIVQNEGAHLTQAEIDDWAVIATQKLIEDHRSKLMLINETVVALRACPNVEILGYRANGRPIHPNKPGTIQTACVVTCSQCHTAIKGMGGPIRGATCVDCWEKK